MGNRLPSKIHPKLRVAVVQAAPEFLDLDGTIDKTIDLMQKAAQEGGEIAGDQVAQLIDRHVFGANFIGNVPGPRRQVDYLPLPVTHRSTSSADWISLAAISRASAALGPASWSTSPDSKEMCRKIFGVVSSRSSNSPTPNVKSSFRTTECPVAGCSRHPDGQWPTRRFRTKKTRSYRG